MHHPKKQHFFIKLQSTIDLNAYGVYKIDMNSRQIIKELKKAGFVLVKVSGDHHKFKHESGKIVIVPIPKKICLLGQQEIFIKWQD